MTVNKPTIKSDLKKVDAHQIDASEYDDAPELTAEQLADATVARPAKPRKRAEGPRDADRKVGMRIRIARLEQKMSQEKLGDQLGLTFQQVQKYEKGANRVASPRLVEISKLLKKPVAYFLQDIQGETAVADNGANDRLLTFLTLDGARELIDAFLELETPQRRAIVTLACKASEPKWSGKT